MPRVVARVNHPKNEWLFNENWGVDVSVSTPHLITALVEEAVSVGRARAPASVRGRPGPPGRGHPGRATRRPPTRRSSTSTSPATPRSWPSSATTTWSCPAATRVLEAGDEVLAMVTPDSEVSHPAILTER